MSGDESVVSPLDDKGLAGLSAVAQQHGYVLTKKDSRKRPPRYEMLERGHTRVQLITDLASDSLSTDVLAAKYKCKPADIKLFSENNSFDIGEQRKAIQDGLKDEFRLLAMHNKSARIAVYEQQISMIEEYVAWSESLGRPVPPNLIKLQQSALRAIAEELGQLRTHVEVDQKIVHSVINGVNPEDLK